MLISTAWSSAEFSSISHPEGSASSGSLDNCINFKNIFGDCPEGDTLPDFSRFPRLFQERVLSALDGSDVWLAYASDADTLSRFLYIQAMIRDIDFELISEYVSLLSDWLTEEQEVYYFLMAFNQTPRLGSMSVDQLMGMAVQMIPTSVQYTCVHMVRFYRIAFSDVGFPVELMTSSLRVHGTKVAVPWVDKFRDAVKYAHGLLGRKRVYVESKLNTLNAEYPPAKIRKPVLIGNKARAPLTPQGTVSLSPIIGASSSKSSGLIIEAACGSHDAAFDVIEFFMRFPDQLFAGAAFAFRNFLDEYPDDVEIVPIGVFQALQQSLLFRASVPKCMHEFLIRFNRKGQDGGPSLPLLFQAYRNACRPATNHGPDAMLSWYNVFILSNVGKKFDAIPVDIRGDMVCASLEYIPAFAESELMDIASYKQTRHHVLFTVITPPPLMVDYQIQYTSPIDWTEHEYSPQVGLTVLACFEDFSYMLKDCSGRINRNRPELLAHVPSAYIESIVNILANSRIIDYEVLKRMVEIQQEDKKKARARRGIHAKDIRSWVDEVLCQRQTPFQIAEWYRVMFAERKPGTIFSNVRDTVEVNVGVAAPVAKYLRRFGDLERERIDQALEQLSHKP